MRVVGEREQIRDVAERWKRQYFNRSSGWGKTISGNTEDTFEALEALPESATAADVARVIGNNSWVGESCTECGDLSTSYLLVGDEPDYESNTVFLCVACAKKVGKAAQLMAAGT